MSPPRKKRRRIARRFSPFRCRSLCALASQQLLRPLLLFSHPDLNSSWHFLEIREKGVYSWIERQRLSRQKINLQVDQKGCDTFETTVGKLSAGRIQICWVPFCDQVFTPFFKITSKIMPEQKRTWKIWICLVQYSSFEVSDPSEMCVCNWPPAVWDSRSLPT